MQRGLAEADHVTQLSRSISHDEAEHAAKLSRSTKTRLSWTQGSAVSNGEFQHQPPLLFTVLLGILGRTLQNNHRFQILKYAIKSQHGTILLSSYVGIAEKARHVQFIVLQVVDLLLPTNYIF